MPAYQHTPERRKAPTENESLGSNGLLPSEIVIGPNVCFDRTGFGVDAAANFLAAKELGLTELNLVRAVTEKNSIKEVQKMGEGFISSCNCIAYGKGQTLQRSRDTLGNPFIHLYEAKR